MSKKKIPVILIAVAAVIAVSITVFNNVRINGAIEEMTGAIEVADINALNKLNEKYLSNDKYSTAYDEALKNKCGSLITEITGAENPEGLDTTVAELNQLLKLSYSLTDEDKNLLITAYQNSYLDYVADSTDAFAVKKMEALASVEELVSIDSSVFFEEQFNKTMSDFCSSKIDSSVAAGQYKQLSAFAKANEGFISGKVDQVYTSYNEGNIKYELANGFYQVMVDANIDLGYATSKRADLQNLYNSKAAFNAGVTAMNNKDYITAFTNFGNVIAADVNAPQKDNYIKTMVPEANRYALGQITALCNAHDYEGARNIITLFDPYVNSQELRSKSSIIDEAESTYKAEVERQNKINQVKNAIRIRRVITSKPDFVGGVDLEIYWTNTSNKTIKYVYFYVRAYNSVNDPVVSEIGWDEVEGVRVTGPVGPGEKYGEEYYWSTVWYNSTISYAKVERIKIEYSDGSTLEIDEEMAPYAVY